MPLNAPVTDAFCNPQPQFPLPPAAAVFLPHGAQSKQLGDRAHRQPRSGRRAALGDRRMLLCWGVLNSTCNTGRHGRARSPMVLSGMASPPSSANPVSTEHESHRGCLTAFSQRCWEGARLCLHRGAGRRGLRAEQLLGSVNHWPCTVPEWCQALTATSLPTAMVPDLFFCSTGTAPWLYF